MGFLSKLFKRRTSAMPPAEPEVVCISSENKRMARAIEKAGQTLWYFEASLNDPQAGQTGFAVKVQLNAGGQQEHIWLNMPEFDTDGNVFGTLGNDPVYITGLSIGQRAGVERTAVSDWMIMENGLLTGGYTIRAIREELPETEHAAFDQLLGFPMDEGADYFKPDCSTPEGAILALEHAFTSRDINKALECKDFYEEARLILERVEMGADEEVIRNTAELLEASFLEYAREDGMPDFTGIRRSFPRQEKLSERHCVVTEVCLYPDGGRSEQRFHTYLTPLGWRVLGLDTSIKR